MKMLLVRAILILPLLLASACAPVEKKDSDYQALTEDLFWPSAPQEAKIKYLYSFRGPLDLGIKPGFLERFLEIFTGDTKQTMLRPYGLAADNDLIVIADPGLKVVHLFKPKEKKYKEISLVSGESLVSPVGIALGPDRIYLSDSILGKIFILDREGKYLQAITGLTRPSGIAVHQQSARLYIADTMEHRVYMYDSEGRQLGSIGTRGSEEGEFNFPSQLALHGDTLYVNDTMNFRIQAFSLDGEYLSSFGELGDGSGQFAHSKGLGTDSEGHIYVVDTLSSHVQIFDPAGRFLLAFGGNGSGLGQFTLPAGLFIADNKIYVVDSFNRRVQVFEFLGGET